MRPLKSHFKMNAKVNLLAHCPEIEALEAQLCLLRMILAFVLSSVSSCLINFYCCFFFFPPGSSNYKGRVC